jgi:hypothetical protein
VVVQGVARDVSAERLRLQGRELRRREGYGMGCKRLCGGNDQRRDDGKRWVEGEGDMCAGARADGGASVVRRAADLHWVALISPRRSGR